MSSDPRSRRRRRARRQRELIVAALQAAAARGQRLAGRERVKRALVSAERDAAVDDGGLSATRRRGRQRVCELESSTTTRRSTIDTDTAPGDRHRTRSIPLTDEMMQQVDLGFATTVRWRDPDPVISWCRSACRPGTSPSRRGCGSGGSAPARTSRSCRPSPTAAWWARSCRCAGAQRDREREARNGHRLGGVLVRTALSVTVSVTVWNRHHMGYWLVLLRGVPPSPSSRPTTRCKIAAAVDWGQID